MRAVVMGGEGADGSLGGGGGDGGLVGRMAEAELESGKTLRADALLYCIGRQGATGGLGLEHAGLKADSRGRIDVNERFQTSVPHIYAAGDVIGFPALASTSSGAISSHPCVLEEQRGWKLQPGGRSKAWGMCRLTSLAVRVSEKV